MNTNKILFIDVDGTLVSYLKYLPDSAIDAIKKARINGHEVILCTGRSKVQLINRIWDIGFDGYILGNGAYIEYKDKVIFHKPLTKDDYHNITNYLNKNKIGYYLETNEGLYMSENFEEVGNIAFQKYALFCGNTNYKNITIYDSLVGIKKECALNPDVNRISYVLNKNTDYIRIKNMFPKLNHGVWGGVSVNPIFGYICESNISKGIGINYLLNYIKKPIDDAISFGDSNIDISMFDHTGYSVCMGNGTNEAKNRARYITDDLENDGLYKAFEYLKLI